MRRRSFIKALGAAVALMAADPMFGGRAWGMDRGIDRRPRIMVLNYGESVTLVPGPDGDWTVVSGPLTPDPERVDNGIYDVEDPGDQDNPWVMSRWPVKLKPGPERRIGGLVDEDGRPLIINVGADPIRFKSNIPQESVDKINRFIDEEIRPGPYHPIRFTEPE